MNTMFAGQPSSKEVDDDRIPEKQGDHRTSTEDQIGFTSLIDDRARQLIISIDTVHLTDSDEIDTQMEEMMSLTEEIECAGTEALRQIQPEQHRTEKKEKNLAGMAHRGDIHPMRPGTDTN